MEPRCSLARCPPRACPPLALSGGRVLETASGKEGARALHTEGAERAAEATEGPGKRSLDESSGYDHQPMHNRKWSRYLLSRADPGCFFNP